MNRTERQNTIETTTELCALLIATEMVSDKVDEADLKTLLSQCSGQLKLATALEFFQYRFSDSFGGNPPL